MRRLEHFPNLVAMFFQRARERGDRPFLWHKADGAWVPLSWAEAARQVAALAAGLRALGLDRGDRVMLVAENRPEWCLSDLAIMAAGCVTVPTYVTNTQADHVHVIGDAGARAAIVSTERLARTLLPAVLRAGHVDHLIAMEPLRTGQADIAVHDWRALVAAHVGDPAADPAAAERAANFGRDDLSCIIYTSGTGGLPRGVRQHHGAILHNVAGTSAIIAEDFGWGDEVFLSFLPLSHAYEHSAGQFLPIGLGGQIYYAEGLEKLAANMAEVRPTIMVVVPRLFEVLRARITKTVRQNGGIGAALLDRALAVGDRRRAGGLRLADRPAALAVDLFLKPRIARRFGGRLKALVSGGAPLNPAVGGFFESVGLIVLQGYGQTEAGPVISANRPRAGMTLDTVGPPLEGTDVRIAPDGEILVRGESVMHGYWRNEEESARALAGGWLQTGDVGEIDAAGRIRITDRKKDLIVNDKGENVSPQKVEGMLTLRPEIAQAMIAGDRRPHMVAVIVPDAEGTAAAQGDAATVRAAVAAAVDRVNRDLAPAERVRRFLIADEPFTIDNGQLTPSMKIRRHVLREVYGDRLGALYRG